MVITAFHKRVIVSPDLSLVFMSGIIATFRPGKGNISALKSIIQEHNPLQKKFVLIFELLLKFNQTSRTLIKCSSKSLNLNHPYQAFSLTS